MGWGSILVGKCMLAMYKEGPGFDPQHKKERDIGRDQSDNTSTYLLEVIVICEIVFVYVIKPSTVSVFL